MAKEDCSNHNNNKLDKQRALVLQGGGALGAYEAGVLKGLRTRLTEKDKEEGKENRPLFDIVAGSSIGAMNAAVLVSNVVKKNRTWNEAVGELERFWKEGIALKEGATPDDDIPPSQKFSMFSWWGPWTKEYPWWGPDGTKINIKDLASIEVARRYYSTKNFVFRGRNVFRIKGTMPDNKFLDPDSKWLLFDDTPLQEQIDEFGEFPIGTSFEKGEPRLLVTAIDIAEGITVTFDSYKKSDGKRKTIYYPRRKYGRNSEDACKNNNDNQVDSNPIVIEYEKGITIEHVMASGTLPELYEPKEISKDPNEEISKRRFWDGGLLSNTPFRELLDAHRDYWVNVEHQDKAPDLDVYIINVHPSTIDIDNIPKKYDDVKDRNNDILYGDRTFNDQYAASLVTDYIDFIEGLTNRAIKYIKEDNNRTAFLYEVESLKAGQAKSTSRTVGEQRKYEDLMRGRFELTTVKRIERKYDPNTSTSLKTGDITPQTIERLIEEGEKDALVFI